MSEGQPGDRFTRISLCLQSWCHRFSLNLFGLTKQKSTHLRERSLTCLTLVLFLRSTIVGIKCGSWRSLVQRRCVVLRFAQACRCWAVSQHIYYTRDASHCNKTIVNCQRRTQLFWTQEVENLPQVFNARRQTVSLGLTIHSPRYLSPCRWNYRPFCSSWPTPTCLSVTSWVQYWLLRSMQNSSTVSSHYQCRNTVYSSLVI